MADTVNTLASFEFTASCRPYRPPTARVQGASTRSRPAMTIRALALVVLAIAARSAAGADATEVNGDMAILELKRLQARRPNASPTCVCTARRACASVVASTSASRRADTASPRCARCTHTHSTLSLRASTCRRPFSRAGGRAEAARGCAAAGHDRARGGPRPRRRGVRRAPRQLRLRCARPRLPRGGGTP